MDDMVHTEKKTKYQKLPFNCSIELAGIPVQMHVHFREAFDLFSSYSGVLVHPCGKEISVTDDEWDCLISRGIAFNGQSEASLLTAYVSDYLMDHDACIIHAAAITFKGKAWLITGLPGTGKTTQVRNLQEMHPGEFQVISGDRPVLKYSEGGTVMVHPSPWNGKENWYGADAAPLEGIICLNRTPENIIDEMSRSDAVIPVYNAIIQSARNEEQVLKTAALQEKLMENCCFYRMESHSVPDSTRLLYDRVFCER